jgi:MFS transporter, NNP family, nitrate/nitrite transporter
MNGSAAALDRPAPSGPSWLRDWRPEELPFWEATGRRIAVRTLVLTTLALTLSFATWFVMSALVVRLGPAGFKFTTTQLFWLAAMPGLAGGTLRILHTFLVPIFGTRNVVTVATGAKLIPCLGLVWAVSHADTPYWAFLVLAFLCGFGGGDFSSFMPSTSLFFPKRLQGAALGVQAGIGNFGVSLTQLVTPWIIGFAAFGALSGTAQPTPKGNVWLQNAPMVWVPFLVVTGIVCWFSLRSVPVRASFREQLDIFSDKHTWFCTITYVMTFGAFSGLSAAFPLMLKTLYGGFEGAPDALKIAFLGPLVGSASRVLFGFVADKTGGAILTQLAGLGMIATSLALAFGGYLQPTSLEQLHGFVALMLILFFLAGIGNAATFRQYPVIFAASPRKGAQVLGWTGAVAAYGPFLFSTLIAVSIAKTGSPSPFFLGLVGYCALAVAVNWFYYSRKGCERPS